MENGVRGCARTEGANSHRGATKKREISRTLLSINLHFSVHAPYSTTFHEPSDILVFFQRVSSYVLLITCPISCRKNALPLPFCWSNFFQPFMFPTELTTSSTPPQPPPPPPLDSLITFPFRGVRSPTLAGPWPCRSAREEDGRAAAFKPLGLTQATGNLRNFVPACRA